MLDASIILEQDLKKKSIGFGGLWRWYES